MIILIIIGVLGLLVIGSWVQDTCLLSLILINTILYLGIPYLLFSEYGMIITLGALLYAFFSSD